MTDRRWLLVTALALAVGPLFAGRHIVPLYNGVGYPDEPYRYVGQPLTRPGGTVLTPSSFSQTLTISDLNQYGATMQSQETGPQIAIYLQEHAITAPKSGSVQITATPVATTGARPTPGTLGSNIYTLATSSPSGTPKFDDTKGKLFLRWPLDKTMTKVEMVYRSQPDSQWQPLFTSKTGNDIYAAGFLGAGQYALASGLSQPNQSGGPASTGISRFVLALLLLIIIVIVFIVIHYISQSSNHGKSKK